MDLFLALLILLCVIGLLIGLAIPRLVLPSKWRPTRLKAFLSYFSALIVLTTLAGMFDSPKRESDNNDNGNSGQVSGQTMESVQAASSPSADKVTEPQNTGTAVHDHDRKTYRSIVLTSAKVRGKDIHVTGHTDLPDASVLKVVFDLWGRQETDAFLGVQTRTAVKDGRFEAALTPPQIDLFKQGPYEIWIVFTPRAQNEAVLALVGKEGENLEGDLTVTEDGLRTLELLAQKDLKLDIESPEVETIIRGSPEDTVTSYLLAWKRQDWQKMASYAQQSWRSRQQDPAAALQSAYGFKRLRDYEIESITDNGLGMKEASCIVHYNFGSGTSVKKRVRAMLVREPGPGDRWQINPISTLGEEDI